jgi:hypothetical protein
VVVRADAQQYILLPQAGQIGDSQAGLHRRQQERVIALPDPSGQAKIARTRTICPGGFQLSQERGDEWGRQVLMGQFGRRAPELMLGKLEQQTKGVPIGVDRVRTDFALGDQAWREERFQA